MNHASSHAGAYGSATNPNERDRILQADNEKYQTNEFNPVKSVAQESVATFSIGIKASDFEYKIFQQPI